MNEENKDVSTEIPAEDAVPKREQQDENTKPAEKKQKFKEKLENLPSAVNAAIDEGKGNIFIEKVQAFIFTLATAIFNSANQAAVQLYLLSPEQKKQVSKVIYIVAFICALGSCISLIFSLSLKNIVFALCFIVSAYLADVIVQSTTLKSKPKKKSKQKSKHKSTPESSSSPAQSVNDDDIL